MISFDFNELPLFFLLTTFVVVIFFQIIQKMLLKAQNLSPGVPSLGFPDIFIRRQNPEELIGITVDGHTALFAVLLSDNNMIIRSVYRK